MGKRSESNTAANRQTTDLTITEMMAKFPKDVVEKAMFQRNYKEYGIALLI
jgi:hypothetical protein